MATVVGKLMLLQAQLPAGQWIWWPLFVALGLHLGFAPAAYAECANAGAVGRKALWLQEQKEPVGAAILLLQAELEEPAAATRMAIAGCLAHVYLRAGQFGRSGVAWQRAAGLKAIAEPKALWLEFAGLHLLSAREAPGPLPWTAVERAAIPQEGSAFVAWLDAVAAVRAHDWSAAAVATDAALTACAKDPCGSAATRKLKKLQVELTAAPPRTWSPTLATLLSAVVPGSGFGYSGHGYDAVLHGGGTLLAAWLTWNTRLAERSLLEQRPGTWVLAGLAGLLYTANVIASHDAAQRRSEIEAWRRETTLLNGAWPELPRLATPDSVDE